MPPLLENIINQAKAFWEGLDKNKKILVISIGAVVVVIFIAMSTYTVKIPKVVLYDNLTNDDYGRITKSLDSMGYSWSGSGTKAIYISSEQRQAAITKLAQENLIPAGVEGYELFDMNRWDETTFDKDIKLHRAIKGSLEKMLMTLDFIKLAKVEFAMPKQNNFMSNTDPIKASVVLIPNAGVDKITRKQVMGIKNLIYRAVPGLKRENITITDNEGHEFVEPDELDKEQRALELVERKKSFEEKERKRWLEEIKERLREFYPEDRISIIRVSLNINWDEITEKQSLVSPVEATPENPESPYPVRKLMPNGTLIISQNKRNERFKGNGFTPGGPTGTEKQLPPGYRDQDYQRSEYGNDDTITNYAYNTTKKVIKHQPWDEQARSIAVAVDGVWKKVGIKDAKDTGWKYERKYFPPSEEELKTLEGLLKASLLYKAIRGDQIEVRHLQKDRTKEFETEDTILNKSKTLKEILLIGSISLVAFILVYLLYRSIRKEVLRKRRVREEELVSQQQLMREAALRVADQSGTEIELSVDERARREILDNALMIAREKPDEVAKLLRTWLAEEH